MSLSFRLASFALVMALASHQLLAQERIALVVGNGDYRYLESLPTPVNDAADLAALLRLAEFVVIEAINVDQQGMLEQLDDFAAKSQSAEIALFFYAGHALQVGGRNYLLPLGADIERQSDLAGNSVPLDVPLGYMDSVPLRVIIVNTPASNSIVKRAGRSLDVAPGLAQLGIDTPGVLIAIGESGPVEAVTYRRNSLLVEALLQRLLAPGLDIRVMFSQVQFQVATSSEQEPWISDSVEYQFYLVAPAEDLSATNAPSEVADILLWDQIKNSRQVREFEYYLRRFPQGLYVPQARQRIEQLNIDSAIGIVSGEAPRIEERQDRQSWLRAQQVGTLQAYQTYLQNYPDGLYVDKARQIVRLLEPDAQIPPAGVAEIREWAQVVRLEDGQSKLSAIREYLEQHPGGLFADEAEDMVATLEQTLGITAGTELSPREGEELLSLTRRQRRLIQSALNSLGHDPGPADGIMGGRTRRAIERWQESQGFQPTSYLTRNQFAALASELLRECRECPKMERVLAGSYTMGSPPDEQGRRDREGEAHEVQVAAFEVGKYEVTFAEWEACVEAGACRAISREEMAIAVLARRPEAAGNHPVVRVSWDDTQTYLQWLSARTNQPYRLPTEAEWEYIARAGSQSRFWYGDDPAYEEVCTYENVADQSGPREGGTIASCADGYSGSAPVGSYRGNRFGLYDLGGNVMEWVEDCFHDSYQGSPSDGSAWVDACSEPGSRVVRGGSWRNFPSDSRSASRARSHSARSYFNVGFRVAKSISPAG